MTMTAKQGFDRRAFLKLAGCAGLAAALPAVSPAIGLAGLTKTLKVAQQNRLMMGTYVSLTVVDESAARAEDALVAALARMEALAPLFDRYDQSGPLAHLRKAGSLSELSPEMTRVLELCARVQRATGGAFDVSVAPVVDAFKQSFAQSRALPSPKVLDEALAAVGGVEHTPAGLRLTQSGAGITLDGVAKGFIVDEGMAAAAKAGARRALINAGGDLAVMGDAGNGRPWKVAVSDPEAPSRAKTVIAMTKGGLATSGSYEVYFDRERLFHHIINPQSGRSPVTDVSSSVRAPQAALADALSTACFVMKPNQAMAFLRAQGLNGLIYTRQGQRYATEGFWS